jgi:hypothetical protein
MEMPAAATQINGISNEKLQTVPTFSVVAQAMI